MARGNQSAAEEVLGRRPRSPPPPPSSSPPLLQLTQRLSLWILTPGPAASGPLLKLRATRVLTAKRRAHASAFMLLLKSTFSGRCCPPGHPAPLGVNQRGSQAAARICRAIGLPRQRPGRDATRLHRRRPGRGREGAGCCLPSGPAPGPGVEPSAAWLGAQGTGGPWGRPSLMASQAESAMRVDG